MATTILDWKCPSEILFGVAPNSSLRVFGSLCFAYNMDRTKDKFSPRAKRCVFVGYSFAQKGYRVYDLDTHMYFVTRDIVFKETIFPFKHFVPNISSVIPQTSLRIVQFDTCFDPRTPEISNSHSLTHTEDSASISQPLHTDSSIHSNPSSFSVHSHHTPVSINHSSSINVLYSAYSHTSIHVALILRHYTRVSKPPTKLQNFICPTLPTTDFISQSFVVQATSPISEPHSYAQASLFPEWR